MFERFTEAARQAIVLAREHAGRLRNNTVDPEHLALGLLDTSTWPSRFLSPAEARAVSALRPELERLCATRARAQDAPYSGEVPFTVPSKRILEDAITAARSIGHNYIGTEHILLGLLSVNDSELQSLFGGAGATYAAVLGRVSQQGALVAEESSKGSQPLNEAKLILVGRGGVGKTSIVNRLVYRRFRPEPPTKGIQITKWNVDLRISGRVLLNIWDFGGQEIMHATHQFFLTRRSLYVLILNGREGGEDADADYWLRIIESFGGDSPVIIALNKVKEHPYDVNRRGLQQKFASIRDFIKTDCRDDTGISDLRRAIEWEADRLEGVRDSFPSSWFAIRDALTQMKTSYLTYEQYVSLCARHGVRDSRSQDALAFYLHNLGVVLNYKDDPRLQDTHVLDPHWVTNGVYKILNSETLERQKGEIRLADLGDMLLAKPYPTRMHLFLIDLMKKFDLCFSFPEDESSYLIPELLDKQEPPEAARFEPKACLNFQYHYPAVPEGLLPRFIVRTHVLSEGQPRWRTGVILRFEGNHALVKADLQDKKVFISVSGSAAGRRRLLAVIRSDFERIHREIQSLRPLGMVPLPDNPDAVIPYDELLVMERNGVRAFPKAIGDRIVEISVTELLDGVDLDPNQVRIAAQEWKRPVRLFYSYSHADEQLRNELETHLKLLQRQGYIELWHDRKIEAGEEWKKKIDEHLAKADVIVLLISADFLASEYCYEVEMRHALERHERRDARVIPVILRDAMWSRAPFAKLQALPKDGLAVTRWPDRDSAWRSVAEGIERVVEEWRDASQRR